MGMNNKEYKKYVQNKATKSNLAVDCVNAFWTGGTICLIGEVLNKLYTPLGLGVKNTSGLVSVTLIFLAVLLTGLNVFDNIAKFAGAGTLVPITGFANAVASPAIDTKAEGFVLGVGAKIFTIAGPVILYGTVASVIYGLVLYIVNLFTPVL
ncbi:MAG: SpoVA/SpoVAEb family sporulation membrane protein [Ruminococcaceae bacterium]|nr:SpoVA/SpoVAEb family sporulation membrane protein [Oscillospiraceae bacterium]